LRDLRKRTLSAADAETVSGNLAGCDNRQVNTGMLLDQLCVDLGYCLPPDERIRLIDDPPQTVDAFTDAVIAAEGRDPVLIDKASRQEVRRVVAKAPGKPMLPRPERGRAC
jgi:hypothetical protein